jgi:hypothetical protein
MEMLSLPLHCLPVFLVQQLGRQQGTGVWLFTASPSNPLLLSLVWQLCHASCGPSSCITVAVSDLHP